MKSGNYFVLTAVMFVILTLLSCTEEADITVHRLTCNFSERPLGTDSSEPLLGWQIRSSGRNIVQSAFHILVATSIEELKENKGTVWDSEKTNPEQSINGGYNHKILFFVIC